MKSTGSRSSRNGLPSASCCHERKTSRSPVRMIWKEVRDFRWRNGPRVKSSTAAEPLNRRNARPIPESEAPREIEAWQDAQTSSST